ncbi:recQ-mediated genome instability protein 1-like isoform X2 [Rhopilema esculentum]
MSDLRVISEASLPNSLSSLEGEKTLSGVYKLQVNVAINSSTSMYSQMRKIERLEGDEDVLREKINQEEKICSDGKQTELRQTSRMLFFELTDGLQVVNAIEYSYLPFFNDNITPGLKIELKGPVVCRDGLLLLCPENIHILGGSAEDLRHEYDLMKIFQNMLSSNERMLGDQVRKGNNRKPDTASLDIEHPSALKQERLRKEQNFLDVNSKCAYPDDDVILDMEDDFIFDAEIGPANVIEAVFPEDEAASDAVCLEAIDSIVGPSTSLASCPNQSLNQSATLKCRSNCQSKTESEELFLLDFITRASIKKHCIKAYIVTLLSKLDIQKTSSSLSVCIDDGSATVSALLSNQVIEKELGFASSSIREISEKSTGIPESMKKELVHCQQRLANSRWKMHVVKTDAQKLTITDMTEWPALE